MSRIWNAEEDIRSLKSLLLFGIRGMAAYAYHAMVLGYENAEVNEFMIKALSILGEDWGMEELLPVVMETGKVNLTCMELLDRAKDVYKRQVADWLVQSRINDAKEELENAILQVEGMVENLQKWEKQLMLGKEAER